MGVGYSLSSATHLRSLIRFDLPQELAGATIHSATLQMTGINSPLSFNMNVRVARVTSSWSESVTWNSQPALDSTGSSLVTLNATSGTNTYSCDVSTIVQAWSNGTPNNGVIVKQDSESTTNRYFAFQTRENSGVKPTLVINFSPAALTATLNGISSSPTSGAPGSSLGWTYNITSSRSSNVLLGASLRSGTENYDLTPTGGALISIGSGNGDYLINRSIPSGIPFGTYSIRGSIYFDTNGSGSIETGSDQVLSAAANYGTISVTDQGSLGIDLSQLNGKKVRGPIFLGDPSPSTTGFPWRWLFIKQGSTTLAQKLIPPNNHLTLNEIPWRKPDGTYISQWADIISGTSTLTVVAEDSSAQGNQSASAAFTVTPQSVLNATISPPVNTFPSFSYPLTRTFTGSSSGGSGSPQYSWYYRSTSPSSTGSASFSPTFETRGTHVVTLKVSDSNNNVSFAQFVAPIGYRTANGSPDASGSGSTLVGPVDVVSGNLHLSTIDLVVPGYGVPFQLTRSYNTAPESSSLSKWRFNVEEYAISGAFSVDGVTFSGRSVLLNRADGTTQEYYLDETGLYRPLNPGNFDLLVETGSGLNATLNLFERDGTQRSYARGRLFPGTTAEQWVLKSVTSPRGLGWTITHNNTVASYLGLPQITNVTDSAGRVFTFSYDAGKHISRVEDPTGRFVTYTWDANHNITAMNDVRGYTTQFTYRTADPGNKLLLRVTRPRGNQPLTSVTYDNSRRVASFSDGDNFLTSFDYSDPNATVVTPPIASERVKFTIAADTRVITSVVEAFGSGNFSTTLAHRTANFDRTRIADHGLLASTTDPANRTASISYLNNHRGLVQSTTEPGSRTTSFAWNDLNPSKNLAVITSVNTAEGRHYGSTPNGFGEVVSTTDPANNASNTIYNALGLPQSVTDALNRTTTFGYDIYGNLTSVTDHTNATAYIVYQEPRNGFPTRFTDRRGYHTHFTYDASGNVLTESDHLGNQTVKTYDSNGNLATSRDRRSNTTTFAYNNRDLLSSVSRTAPVNGSNATVTESIGYDGMGRIASQQNGRGNTSHRSYNSRGLLSHVVNGEGEEILSLTYNPDGTIATQTTGSGSTKSTLTFGYDSSGRRTSVTDSLGNQEILTYNNDNQVMSERDARGNLTSYTYDSAARLATVTTPTSAGSATASAFYDAIGRLTEVRDPRGYSTTYSFDDPNRRVTERDHSNRAWVRAFDPEGNLLTENFPDGRSFSYTYDTLGRLDYLNYGGGRFADPSYDTDSNMIGLADHLGTTSYAYDSLSRLNSVTDPYGQTVSYWYDAASNLSRITYPGSGKIVNYTFDNAERMKTVAPWSGGTFTYTWRTDNLPSRITNGNATYTDYGYDAAARLTSLVTRNGSGTAFITQNLTLDANGNITALQGDQPTAPPTDASKSMTYDVTNRIVTDGGSSVVHDAAGRLTSNPAGTAGAATWEGRDWLSTFTPTGGNTTSYGYNGLGQRLTKNQGGNATRYVLDLNQALPAVLMENNGSNTPQRYYIHGVGGLLASVDTANTVSTYHFNHRGDTLALTNSSGAVAESYGYSPYGATTASNATWNPFRFIGQYGVMDERNGLQFMRARYYSPNMGRFLSLDQLPGNLGDPRTLNRFAYVSGNPISFTDPSGFTSEAAISHLRTELAELKSTQDRYRQTADEFRRRIVEGRGQRLGNFKKQKSYLEKASSLDESIVRLERQIRAYNEISEIDAASMEFGLLGDLIETGITGKVSKGFGVGAGNIIGGFATAVNTTKLVQIGDRSGAAKQVAKFVVCDFVVGGAATSATSASGPIAIFAGIAASEGCGYAFDRIASSWGKVKITDQQRKILDQYTAKSYGF